MDSFASYHHRLWTWSGLVLKRVVQFTGWWMGVAFVSWACVITLIPAALITECVISARAGTLGFGDIFRTVVYSAFSISLIMVFPPPIVWGLTKELWRGIPFILYILTFGLLRVPIGGVHRRKGRKRMTRDIFARPIVLIFVALVLGAAWATYRWSYAIPNNAAEPVFAKLKAAYVRQGDPDPELSKWITYLPAQPYADFLDQHPGTKFEEDARQMFTKLAAAEAAKLLNYQGRDNLRLAVDMVYAGTGIKRSRRVANSTVLSELYYTSWMQGGRAAWTYEDADYYRQLLEEGNPDDKWFEGLRIAYRKIVGGVMRNKIVVAYNGNPNGDYQAPIRGSDTPTQFERRLDVLDAETKGDLGLRLWRQLEEARR